jgi:hypothetical protein
MSSYDEALFIQSLKRRACFGTVTLDDVSAAFWDASRDLEAGLIEHVPHNLELARAKVREEIAPLLTHMLPQHGLRVRTA